MGLEAEAARALQSGELAQSLIQSINIFWLVVAIGLPIFGMIIYKYVLSSFADRLILFISNKAWTDKGRLVEFKGEKWIIEKIDIFRVSLAKVAIVKNRGRTERMKKTLTIPTSKYIGSDIIFYEYNELYSEEDINESNKEDTN